MTAVEIKGIHRMKVDGRKCFPVFGRRCRSSLASQFRIKKLLGDHDSRNSQEIY